MEAGKYWKRPVPVESVQLDVDNLADVAEWCGGEPDGDGVLVLTKRAQLPARPGDFVNKAHWGEYYPIGPDVHAEACWTREQFMDAIRRALEGLPLTLPELNQAAARVFSELICVPADGAP